MTNFDERHIGTISAMICVCLHAGLTLLGVLLKAEVIGAVIPREISDRQRKRIAQRERTEFVFALNVTAVEPGARTRLFNTLMAFLLFDDGRIALETMYIKYFPSSRKSKWSADTSSNILFVISLSRDLVIS